MYRTTDSTINLLCAFHMKTVAMRYSRFVPRLYNLARSLGFEKGKIMPSRAFCSDESQGYPIILIAKHFGTFPFNHGLVGGVIATDRHGPYAQHGTDLVIIQASHVGYNPATQEFGVYRRLQTKDQNLTYSCGKICHSLEWYLHEYEFARKNIFLVKKNNKYKITIDNQLLQTEREQGLFLKLDYFIDYDPASFPEPLLSLSTSKVFDASAELSKYLDTLNWDDGHEETIGDHLKAEHFFFRKNINFLSQGIDHIEGNLLKVMQYIVTSDSPALTAAQANTQVEYDCAFRIIAQHPAYQGKKLLFISGLNVDISPDKGQLFPLTKFVPWAAYYHDQNNNQQTWEQSEVFERLSEQSIKNPDQVDLEEAIEKMRNEKEIQLPF